MPKKTKRNAYSTFAAEYRDKQRTNGRILTMEQAISEAAKYWEKMTQSEKDKYKQRSKMESVQPKSANEKYTSQGIPVSYIENEKREKDADERLMKKYVQEMVNNAAIKDALEEESFYFIMANYFVRINEDEIYVPAEISLCVYSLKQGVKNTFHSFINPGEIKMGYAFQAQQHADLIHKLPLPPKAMGERNYHKIFKEILKFISPSDGPQKYPALFTSSEFVPIIKSILEQMDENIILKVYPIQYLFYTLKRATAEKGQNPEPESIHITNAIFDRDPFEYQQGISCNYHEEKDASKFCALSFVVRWGYVFSDYMSNDLAIALIPGRHVPADVDIKPFGEVNTSMEFSETDDIQFDRQTDITMPNVSLHRFKEECSSFVTVNSDQKEDFPPLGSRSSKNRMESQKLQFDQRSIASSSQKSRINETNKYNDDDEDHDDDDEKASTNTENVWAARSRKVPRPPNEDSFSYGLLSRGTGRGALIKEERQEKLPKPSMGGYGRGRLFKD